MANIPSEIPEKAAIIALLKSRDCSKFLQMNNVHTYQELFRFWEDNAESFNCLPDYLKQLFAIIPDETLLNFGIFLNKSGLITNPQVVAGGNHTDIIIENEVPATDSVPSVYILAGTSAQRLIVRNNTFIGYLLIAGGSKIQELVVEDGSKVARVYINTCNQFDSGIVTLTCMGVNGVEYFTVEPATQVQQIT